jgi:hypothetical protein
VRRTLEDRIAGVLLGTAVGDALGLPREGLSQRRLEIIAAALAAALEPGRQPARSRRGAPFWPGSLPRNALFMTLVLGHGLRRLLPPY